MPSGTTPRVRASSSSPYSSVWKPLPSAQRAAAYLVCAVAALVAAGLTAFGMLGIRSDRSLEEAQAPVASGHDDTRQPAPM
ncbi:hypothetical protein G3I31_08710 [Streptomyces sp. SID9913]|uniref:hypothetical protein n=1 Tax=Streptomyces sp. SID9913 TaxID=2706117 RepID=UPI0013DC81C9|nr:hypothetical protein [Streptomyces sp. SID9913]NED18215.1 hypothetical protein [Streptomyces sp. SID9913]